MQVNSLQTLLLIIVISVTATTAEQDRNHKKRQIYREQVLPHAGGRIPDTAFEADRLFLNQLQKEGIAVPDGVVAEQRNPQVYPFYNKIPRTVFRIALSSDARFIPEVGRYQYNEVPTLETTYLYPQIHGHKVTLMPKTIAQPIYKQFELHNPHLNQVKFQPKKKGQLINIPHGAGKAYTKSSINAESYQNFNIINVPVGHSLSSVAPKTSTVALPSFFDSSNTHYQTDFGSANLINEFDDFFNHFDLYESQEGSAFNSKEHTIDLPITGFDPNPTQTLY